MTSQTAQMCTFTLLLRALIVCFSLKWKIGQKRVVNRLFEVKRYKYKHIKTRLCTCHQQSVPWQKYWRHRCQLFLFTLTTRAVTIVKLTLQPTQNFGLLPTLRKGYILIAPNHHGPLPPLRVGYDRKVSRRIIFLPPRATTAAWWKVASISTPISEPTNGPFASGNLSNSAGVHVHVGIARISPMTVGTPWRRVLLCHRRPSFVPGWHS